MAKWADIDTSLLVADSPLDGALTRQFGQDNLEVLEDQLVGDLSTIPMSDAAISHTVSDADWHWLSTDVMAIPIYRTADGSAYRPITVLFHARATTSKATVRVALAPRLTAAALDASGEIPDAVYDDVTVVTTGWDWYSVTIMPDERSVGHADISGEGIWRRQEVCFLMLAHKQSGSSGGVEVLEIALKEG